MDIEELISNIDQYDEITKQFYNNYIKDKDLSFDKLLKNSLKQSSFSKIPLMYFSDELLNSATNLTPLIH